LSKPGDRVEFVPKEEDVESDEIPLRDLYERWCKAFNQKREPDEMARRFNKFKNRVLCIHSMNKANQSCKGTRVADKKEISTEYEVVYGRLFVADLPEGRELLVPNDEFIKRRWIPYLP
ncbi:unnamed protein product, partial [Miscanthus lutarioriparius]